MAIIYSYPKLTSLQNKDLLLISDVSSKNKPTMRVELGDLANFITTSTGTVTGSGTTNTLPIWTDGPNGKLGDSIIDQDYTNPTTGARVNGDLQINKPGSGPLYAPSIIFTANNNGTPPLGVMQFRSDGVGFITSQGSGTSGSLTMELGYDATTDFAIRRIAPASGTSVDMLRINPAGDAEITRSLKITPSSSTTTQEYVSAFNAFQVNKPTPGSTDTRRTGVVHIGRGSNGNFTEFDHALNLYTPSDFSDPTNFSDAKAFEYQWNDNYTFIRLEAANYGAGNISPLWQVGDFGETTSARWMVSSGDYAKYSDGSIDFFTVTPFDSTFKVPLSVQNTLIDSLSQPGAREQVLTSTGTGVEWRDAGSITTTLEPHFQTATPGGTGTYTFSNNIVDFNWSGGSGTYTYILPSATAIPYRKIRFVNDNTVSASNKIRITAPSGQTIDGGAFYEINKEYNGCAVWSDGNEWIVIQAKA